MTALRQATSAAAIAGRTFIAADRLDQVPLIVDALHAHRRRQAARPQTIGAVESILDMRARRPGPAKLAVLAEIRALLDDPALDELDDKERAELLELRPPDDLAPITADDLPPSSRDQFTEKDGRVGYSIAVRPAKQLDEWNGHDLIRFASAVRELHLARRRDRHDLGRERDLRGHRRRRSSATARSSPRSRRSG